MIHQLLGQIETILQTGFANVGNSPAGNISAGVPVAPGALPRIALYPGLLEISQTVTDGVSSQVRPQAFQERIVVDTISPKGPYSLENRPLDGSLVCHAVYQEGAVGEHRKLLVENKDFTIDYAGVSLSFSTDISGAGVLLMQYSFPGMFTVREFNQVFFVDIFDIAPGSLERWSALTTAMILTNHDKLLQEFKSTKHSVPTYSSAHSLRSIHLLEGEPLLTTSPFKMQLKFLAQGQIQLVKAIVGDFGLIEHIHSPGKTGTPVDIEPELG